MYKIDTSQARTDIYGVGKGEAQVINLQPYQDRMAQQEKEDYLDRKEKAKQKQGHEEDAYTQLGGLNKIDILPADQPYFAQKQADLYSYVKSNIDKIRNGDSSALIGFQQQLGDIYNRAALSKNYREYGESALAEAKKDGFDNYREESVGNFLSKMSRKDGNYEDWDTSNLGLQKNINYSKRVTGDLSTYAQRMAQDSPTQKVFSVKQAKDLIYNDLYSDPSLLEQANYDFNKASKEDKEKYGNPKDGIEYYQNKYAPQLTVNDKKDAYFTGIGGGSNKPDQTVNSTFTKHGKNDWEMTVDYTKPPDNPYQTMPDPSGSGVSVDAKPQKVIHKNGKTLVQSITKPDKDGNTKVIETDYEHGGAEILHDKFNIDNVFRIADGETPEHMKIKRYDVSKTKKETISGEDKAALDWANSNPSDKRAKAIKDKLKAKGVI